MEVIFNHWKRINLGGNLNSLICQPLVSVTWTTQHRERFQYGIALDGFHDLDSLRHNIDALPLHH